MQPLNRAPKQYDQSTFQRIVEDIYSKIDGVDKKVVSLAKPQEIPPAAASEGPKTQKYAPTPQIGKFDFSVFGLGNFIVAYVTNPLQFRLELGLGQWWFEYHLKQVTLPTLEFTCYTNSTNMIRLTSYAPVAGENTFKKFNMIGDTIMWVPAAHAGTKWAMKCRAVSPLGRSSAWSAAIQAST